MIGTSGTAQPPRRLLLVLAPLLLGIVVLGFLAGCSGSTTTTGSTTGSGSDQVSTTDTQAPPTTDPNAPKPGGTLRIASPGAKPDPYDPHASEGTGYNLIRFGNVFEHLSVVQDDGKIVPQLAASFTPNATADEWTVALRPDVKWHDGKPLTADDVIASVTRILDPETLAKGASLLAFIDSADVSKVDDLAVKFKLKSPYGMFPDVWSNKYLYIVPKDFDAAKPIGTGPFRVEKDTPGQSFTLVPFGDYWGDKAYVDSIVVTQIDDNAAASRALQSGDVDITESIPLSEGASIESDSNLRLLKSPAWQIFPIIMRTDKAPFDNPKLRQAMRLIADRDQIVKIALNGYGVVGNDFVDRALVWGDPGLAQRTRDLEEAKALLAEVGADKMTFELATTNGSAGMVETAQVFAEQAKAAGLNIKVLNLDPPTYLAKYGEWDFAVDWFIDGYLGIVTRALLPGGAFNNSHWDDEEFNGLAAQAFAATDDQVRADLIHKMQAIEYERGPMVVYGFADVLNAYRSSVHGLQPNAAGEALQHLNKVWVDQ